MPSYQNTKGVHHILKKSLDLSDVTIQQALAGFGLLDQWKSEQKVKDDYRAKAASRWSEATVLKQ
jgi:hypothetical protein